MHLDAFWAAFRAIVGAAVLIIADQFLLLGIDRDDGLPRSLCRNDFRVDVLELGIPIGVLRAFVRLAIGLPREAEFGQLGANRLVADLMAQPREFRGQLFQALGHPDQCPHRIAKRHGLDETAQIIDERRILLAECQATAALAAHAIFRERASIEIVLAAIDRRARQTCDLGDGGEPAIASGPHLGSSEQPPPAFVEPVAKAVPTFFDALPVDHVSAIVVFAGDGNPPTVSHSVTRPQIAIRL